MSEVVIRQVSPDDRPALQRMLELYQYELSDIWDQELDSRGEFGYSLDRYFGESACCPFVATVNARYAGFALVDGAVKLSASGYWMDQFFVMKKYRTQGLGRLMAQHVFGELPGLWEVGQMSANLPAQRFWRKLIGEWTSGAFRERTIDSGPWIGVIQSFDAQAKPRN